MLDSYDLLEKSETNTADELFKEGLTERHRTLLKLLDEYVQFKPNWSIEFALEIIEKKRKGQKLSEKEVELLNSLRKEMAPFSRLSDHPKADGVLEVAKTIEEDWGYKFKLDEADMLIELFDDETLFAGLEEMYMRLNTMHEFDFDSNVFTSLKEISKSSSEVKNNLIGWAKLYDTLGMPITNSIKNKNFEKYVRLAMDPDISMLTVSGAIDMLKPLLADDFITRINPAEDLKLLNDFGRQSSTKKEATIELLSTLTKFGYGIKANHLGELCENIDIAKKIFPEMFDALDKKPMDFTNYWSASRLVDSVIDLHAFNYLDLALNDVQDRKAFLKDVGQRVQERGVGDFDMSTFSHEINQLSRDCSGSELVKEIGKIREKHMKANNLKDFSISKYIGTNGTLCDLIGTMLGKNTSEKLLNDLVKDGTITLSHNRRIAYIQNLIEKQSLMQFSEEYRPIVELLQNAIDAKSGDTDYKVNVNVSKDCILVSDSGKGMDIESILTDLVLPFKTGKSDCLDVSRGRFGVGFYAVFNYLIRNPTTFLEVDSKKNGDAYKIIFSCADGKAGGLSFKIVKSNKETKGTDVRLVGLNAFNINKCANQIEDCLYFLNPEDAKITVNGRQINMLNHNAMVSAPGQGNFNMYLNMKKGTGMLKVFSRGIFVEKMETGSYMTFELDLPDAGLTEGRSKIKEEGLEDSAKRCMEMVLNYGSKSKGDHDKVYMALNFLDSFNSWLTEKGRKDVILKNLPPQRLKEMLENLQLMEIGSGAGLEEFVDTSDLIFVGERVREYCLNNGIKSTNVVDYLRSQDLFDNMENSKELMCGVVKQLKAAGFDEDRYHARYVAVNPGASPFFKYQMKRGIELECYVNIAHPIFSNPDSFDSYALRTIIKQAGVGAPNKIYSDDLMALMGQAGVGNG